MITDVTLLGYKIILANNHNLCWRLAMVARQRGRLNGELR